jgi:hypothetical protein
MVFRLRPRFPAAGVTVCRWGRYVTLKAHNDLYIRYYLLRMVTLRTLRRRPAAVGHLLDEDHGVGAGPPSTQTEGLSPSAARKPARLGSPEACAQSGRLGEALRRLA